MYKTIRVFCSHVFLVFEYRGKIMPNLFKIHWKLQVSYMLIKRVCLIERANIKKYWSDLKNLSVLYAISHYE